MITSENVATIEDDSCCCMSVEMPLENVTFVGNTALKCRTQSKDGVYWMVKI